MLVFKSLLLSIRPLEPLLTEKDIELHGAKFGFPHREGIMSLKSSPGGQSFSFNTIGLPSGSCSRSASQENKCQ